MLTPPERRLARHALGLDNPDARGKSYRNRYFAGAGTHEYCAWLVLVNKGYAEEHTTQGALHHFSLTIDGARLALKTGERLCPEDFPEQVQPVQ